MNTTKPTPVDSVEQIARELQSLRFKQMSLKPLPPVQVARDALMDATARHSVDPGFLPQLQAAQHVLAERLEKHDQFVVLGKEIAAMEERLQAAKERVRMENATQADERLSAAMTDYRQASLTCARSFRRLLNAARNSGNTPGAAHTIPDLSVHLPAVTPISNQGTTGQAMSAGLLPIEQED